MKTITSNPREFAQAFEKEIKEKVETRFSVPHDQLTLLMNDEDGVYFSEEQPDTFCCLVVGNNGFLYLVTAHVDEEGTLSDFKADIVS